MSLLAELRRRNVIRVGIAYVVVAWLLLQIADVVLNNIAAPDWLFQFILLLLGIGLPLALVMAWAFELTPEGLKRDFEVDRSQSIRHVTGRKLDRLIIVVLVVALAYFIWESRISEDQPVALSTTKDQSVAVLPFVNMSADLEQEYFSDGMTEEIINALVKIPGLSVPARTSVFGFKGYQGDVREVGVELGVEHILEGSIRSQGEQVRITAQLIKVDDGFHLWSETYDRQLVNIFAVQEEIATAIAEVLVGELGVQAVPNRTRNMEAYDLYLHGRSLLRNRDSEALSVLQQAIEADSEFAPAWAALAIAYQVEGYISESPHTQQKAEEMARHALTLDPENVDALDALASVLRDTWQWEESEMRFEAALSIDPQSAELLEDYGEFLIGVARFDEMLEVAERAYSIDPNLMVLVDVYVMALTIHGRFDEALEVIDRFKNTPEYFGPLWRLPVLLGRNDVEAAVSLLETLDEDEFPEGFSAAMIRLLTNPDDTDARDYLRGTFSDENHSIYKGRRLFSRHVLAFSGDSEYVVNTMLELFTKTGWGNAEEIWGPSMSKARQDPSFQELLEFLNLPEYWDNTAWPDICQRKDDGAIACN